MSKAEALRSSLLGLSKELCTKYKIRWIVERRHDLKVAKWWCFDDLPGDSAESEFCLLQNRSQECAGDGSFPAILRRGGC